MINSIDFDDIMRQILTIAAPTRIYLFGSYAKGIPTSNSDIDLCIVFPDSEKHVDLSSIRLSLVKCQKALDLIAFSEQEFNDQQTIWWSIPSQVLQEGVKLYERAA